MRRAADESAVAITRDGYAGTSACPTWLSAHLFFSAPSIYSNEADAVVLTVVAPFLAVCREARWVNNYFFIRYIDHGQPHIRLRVKAPTGVLDDLVRPALEEMVRDRSRDASIHADRTAPPRGSLTGGVRTLRWMPYEPETERYGGDSGLVVAEGIFRASTDAATEFIRRFDSSRRSSRMGKALLAMLAIMHAFHDQRSDVSRFAFQYGAHYLRVLSPLTTQTENTMRSFRHGFSRQSEHVTNYVAAAFDQLADGGGTSPILNVYHAAMRNQSATLRRLCADGVLTIGARRLESWTHVIATLLPSYMHMMNNRLGVSILEESYLAYLIQCALGERSAHV